MLKNQFHAITVFGLFVLIVTTYLIMAWYYPVAYVWGTYEDLYGEWGQTYTYAFACLFSAALAFMRTRYRWFFALLSLACLYVVMEEISWGQRVIGFDTPELLKRHNLQHETNIHNLLVGPVRTITKDIIEYTLATALFLFGVLYPLTLKFKWSVAQWFDRKGFAAPPLYLWPFFLTAAWFELSPIHFNEAEIAELLVGSSLAIMTAHYCFIQRRQLDTQNALCLPDGTSIRFSLIIVAMAFAVGVLAAITTQSMYSDPVKRAKMNGRIFNGYEKFAKRYTRLERPELALRLLERVHQSEPHRTSVQRRIARLYKKMGDEEKFLHFNQLALDIGLQKYTEKPESRSTNLLLAYTYRQRGEFSKASFHAQRAHAAARAKVKEDPDSAHAAYWLAKTYRLRGDKVAALAEYKRAFELRPVSRKYRRAYYSMRRRVPSTQ